jgi:hypothetical protein
MTTKKGGGEIGPGAAALAEAEAQRAELARRLGDLESELRKLGRQPGDIDKAAELHARAAAYRSAIGAIDDDLPQLRQAAQRERDAATNTENAGQIAELRRREAADLAAIVAATRTLETACGELRETGRALGRLGAFPGAASRVAGRLGKAVDGALRNWRMVDPALLGLPVPEPRAEPMAEAEKNIDRIKKLLTEARKMKGNESAVKQRVESLAFGLRAEEARLRRLQGREDPAPEEVDSFTRFLNMGA